MTNLVGADLQKTIYSKHQKALLKLLREHRIKVGLSQEMLAKTLERPQSFVSKYESGERRLDLAELRQICKVLDTPLVELIQRWEKIIDEA